MASIFSRIIAGELPGHFVWKDEHAVAFMTIQPIRSGHLLYAMLADPSMNRQLQDISPDFAKISVESMRKDLRDIVADSQESQTDVAAETAAGAAPGTPRPAGAGGKTPSLDQFTVNLTARARTVPPGVRR